MSEIRHDNAHRSHPDQLMASALGVCWHSPTADRWPCSDAVPPSAAVPDPADVEKAARAIAASAVGLDEMDEDGWEYYLDAQQQEEYLRMAAATLAAVRPSPDSEAVARVEALARVLVDAPGQGPVAAALIFGALAGGDAAKLAEYERAALGTGDREGADRG